MEGEPTAFDKALDLIQGAGLSHPDGELLACFLQKSVDKDRAARHILDATGRNEDKATGLLNLLAHWKALIQNLIQTRQSAAQCEKHLSEKIIARDGVCYLTGGHGSWRDPLVVTNIFPAAFDISDLVLAAFLSPRHEEWLSSYLSTVESRYRSPSNLWLVRQSAADAFAKGFFQVEIETFGTFVHTTNVDWPNFPPIALQDSASREVGPPRVPPSIIDSPDPTALDILSRFAEPIRWSSIGENISQPDLSRPSPSATGPTSWLLTMRNTCCSLLLAAWRILPAAFRASVYRGLGFLGRRIFGPSNSFRVQRLPFGMYLKTGISARYGSLFNEYSALDLLRRETNVPVPRPLDIISDAGKSYLLTSRQPGRLLGTRIDTLSDDHLRLLVSDLQYCLGMIRGLQRDRSLQSTIANTVGEACYDGRINTAHDYDSDFVGPFKTEHDFNETLRSPHLPDVVHRSDHRIVFTHGDLNLRNILVDENGRLSGIVDWETAGWYPDYWEFTKAHFSTRLKWRWLRSVVEPTFRDFGDFSKELDIEKNLWWYCY